ncbi:hypothetical protein BOX15_Mlig008036g1 [Macrostomum lignano]|uniref:Phospholipase B-like n=1 Tax=Macrostomum lignano TaxID=282301 RepID=A0A267GS12_9PLAT|nr:hypothetical protein BOX15_Mlig008036g1 [Macrostomum lignano]
MQSTLSFVLLAALLIAGFTEFTTSAVVEHDNRGDRSLRLRWPKQRNTVWQMDQLTHKPTIQEPTKSRNYPPWVTPPPNGRDALVKASIVYKNGKFKIMPNTWAPNSVAYGSLAKTLNKTGWDILDVISGTDAALRNDTASMYAAGLVEGYLTADRIALMYTNMMANFFGTEQSRKVLLPKVRQFLTRQFQWGRQFAAANPQSAVARHTGFVLAQLQGLIDGYLARNDTVVRDPFVLHLLNAVGDMLDLQTALNNTKEDHFMRMSQSEFTTFFQKAGHCSALIRVTPGLEKIFMGHSSWFVYAAALRIFKNYLLKLNDKDLSSPLISFSSYPGFLESLDDFYILDSGMVMLQTTNSVFNVSLYKTEASEPVGMATGSSGQSDCEEWKPLGVGDDSAELRDLQQSVHGDRSTQNPTKRVHR